MSMDRKAELTARFNRNRNAKNKQKSKKYIKEKRKHEHDLKDSGILRNPDKSGE